MSRISVRKATDVAFEFLGPLLQIIGIMLFLFGVFVFLWDYLAVPATPLTVSDAGVVLPASGIVLLVMGSIIVRSVEVDSEDEYRLDPLPSSSAELSRERLEYSATPPRASSCPSWGMSTGMENFSVLHATHRSGRWGHQQVNRWHGPWWRRG
jgi:hypothetical protein